MLITTVVPLGFAKPIPVRCGMSSSIRTASRWPFRRDMRYYRAGTARHMSTSMIARLHPLLIAVAVALATTAGAAAEGAKPHRVAIQVDQNDPAVMNMALNNTR